MHIFSGNHSEYKQLKPLPNWERASEEVQLKYSVLFYCTLQVNVALNYHAGYNKHPSPFILHTYFSPW